MEKQFVTYEIALLLKELGFNEMCLGMYIKIQLHKARFKYMLDICKTNDSISKFFIHQPGNCAAPLWQQAIDWLREKHKTEIVVWDYYSKGYYYAINGLTNELNQNLQETFHAAREQAILKAIEIIKSNQNENTH